MLSRVVESRVVVEIKNFLMDYFSKKVEIRSRNIFSNWLVFFVWNWVIMLGEGYIYSEGDRIKNFISWVVWMNEEGVWDDIE